MIVFGWCQRCRRMRNVRVTHWWTSLVVGVCRACEDK